MSDTTDAPEKTNALRKPYPTDLTDEQWQAASPLLATSAARGRPTVQDLREVLNGILYHEAVKCPWRFLPHDLPPWPTVYFYARRWLADGSWDIILRAIKQKAPEQQPAPEPEEAAKS